MQIKLNRMYILVAQQINKRFSLCSAMFASQTKHTEKKIISPWSGVRQLHHRNRVNSCSNNNHSEHAEHYRMQAIGEEQSTEEKKAK